MYPILFRLGDFEFHSFGLMMALAWLAASVYLDAQFRRRHLPPRLVTDLVVWALVGALIGARAMFLAVEYPAWTADVWSAIFSRSGFVFYGGLIGGVIGGVWAVRKERGPIAEVGDLVAPALALGLCIGRIGCFLAGDDYGKPTSVAWAVTFTDENSLAPLGVALHPVQLYLSFNALVLFVILHVRLTRRAFCGEILSLFLILYACTRFGWEFFRGDPRGIYGPLSTSQWISLLVLPAGICLYIFLKSKSRAGSPG